MAENLKKKMLEKEKAIDLICGPDAYRNLPHMLKAVEGGGPAAGKYIFCLHFYWRISVKGVLFLFSVNVQLSLEETYADVSPVRVDEESKTAFVCVSPLLRL